MKSRFALIVAAALAAATPGMAQELVFPSLSYRTGPFAAGGIPYADGYADYFTLLNERDGGIGGIRVSVPECETAYNTEKGVECYEATKGKGALVYQPLSTGISYQLIPKVTADKIPMLQMGYGRTSAANGSVFEWVFNPPANYWDGASLIVKHLLEENAGDLKGKKIALLYHNSAYGKEPIRTLEELSKKHGFVLTTIPVDSPGQEQKSQWLQIRRDKPDYVVLWGWGVMNQVAIQEAANIRFPMDKLIGSWWSGSENDVLPAGAASQGYKAVAFHAGGMDFPIYADLKQYVYDKGKAAGAGDQWGSMVYNRGVYAAMVAAEAARKAQELSGQKQITAVQMRDGLEALSIDEAKLKELGLEGFGATFHTDCKTHGGQGRGMIVQWDAAAKKWNNVTAFMEPDKDVINALIEEDSMAYAKEANITPRCK